MQPDLTLSEQKHVRIALRYLRVRFGTAAVADALGFQLDTIDKVTRGVRAVTPTMAFRVARFADAPIDALLAGQCVPVGTCPHCGRAPDFTDEETVISDRPTITTASSV